MMRERAEKFHWRRLHSTVCIAAVLSAGCSTTPIVSRESPPPQIAAPTPTAPPAAGEPRVAGPSKTPPSPTPQVTFTPATWADLPGWREEDLSHAWTALLASCSVLARREMWRDLCAAATRAPPSDAEGVRQFMEQHFTPYQVASADSGAEGLITGYYEPVLMGSRTRTARYRYAIYRVPDDLVVVDLASLYPELKNMRLRGRLDGRRLVAYHDRARIENADAPLRGHEIVWVDDPYDLFFLHIQGSGRIRLDNGEMIRVGYAEQNGHPYRAVGRELIERGELKREEVSLQAIRAWLRANEDKSTALMNTNPSYIFFRELPATADGPPGSLGVPLTAGRSIAVDARYVPLGFPVFISTNWPKSSRPLNRLTFAQDTGGAIRGAVRADFFWGSDQAAEREAGQMKEPLRMWLLLPHGHPLPGSAAGG